MFGTRIHNYWEEIHARFKAMLERLADRPSQEDVDKARDILGIPEGAILTEEVARSRYKIMAKMTHPDAGGASEAFITLKDSLDILIKYMGFDKTETV